VGAQGAGAEVRPQLPKTSAAEFIPYICVGAPDCAVTTIEAGARIIWLLTTCAPRCSYH